MINKQDKVIQEFWCRSGAATVLPIRFEWNCDAAEFYRALRSYVRGEPVTTPSLPPNDRLTNELDAAYQQIIDTRQLILAKLNTFASDLEWVVDSNNVIH